MLYLEPIEKTAVLIHVEGRFFHILLDARLLSVAYQKSRTGSTHHNPVAPNPPIWAMQRYIDGFGSCCRNSRCQNERRVCEE
jgi:hypothetical protein